MTDILDMYKKMIYSIVPDNLKTQLDKEKGSLGEGVKYVLLGIAVMVAMSLVGIAIQFLLGGSLALNSESRGMESFGAAGLSTGLEIIIVIILAPILILIWTFLATGVMWLLAKVLGGKGTFAEQYYHFAIVGGGMSIITSILSIIDCLGLIEILASLYFLYPTYLIYKSVHKLSSTRSVILVLLPIILFIVLVIAMFVLIGTMFASLIAALSSTGAAY